MKPNGDLNLDKEGETESHTLRNSHLVLFTLTNLFPSGSLQLVLTSQHQHCIKDPLTHVVRMRTDTQWLANNKCCNQTTDT